jgi:protein TonB
MAFETFMTVDKLKPKKGRRLMYALSGASHVGLLVVGVAASYARVDEVAPKAVPVTIYSQVVAPPPPPARGGKPPEVIKHPPKSHVVQPPSRIVQPSVAQKVENDEEQAGPPVKGNKTGVTGSLAPGDPPAPKPAQFLPPNVGRGQLAIDPQAEQHRAHLSPLIQRSGMELSALLKVCVDRDGNVVDVKMLTKVSDEIDAAFMSAIRTWRYKPYRVADHPVPFCTSVRYQVSTGH